MGRHRIFNNRRNLDASILILAEEEVMAGSFEGTKNTLVCRRFMKNEVVHTLLILARFV